MTRMVHLSAAALALILLAAHPASADGPVRVPLVFSPPSFPINGVCDFDVQADILENKEYTKTFAADAAGTVRQLTNGRLVIRLTNLVSHASVTRNISGPGETLIFADGSNTLTATGAWLMFFFPGVLGAGTPGTLFINHGQIVLHTEAGLPFRQSILKQTGTQEDLCAVLGDQWPAIRYPVARDGAESADSGAIAAGDGAADGEPRPIEDGSGPLIVYGPVSVQGDVSPNRRSRPAVPLRGVAESGILVACHGEVTRAPPSSDEPSQGTCAV